MEVLFLLYLSNMSNMYIQYKPGGFLFSHLTQWRGLRVGSRDLSIFSTHRGGLLISA